MAFLTTIKLTEAQGTNITTTAASATGDTFTYTNNTMLYIVNSSGVAVDVTIQAINATSFLPGTGNLIKNNIVMSLAGGANAILDCRSIAYRGNIGLVDVAYSDDAGITLAPFEIDRV